MKTLCEILLFVVLLVITICIGRKVFGSYFNKESIKSLFENRMIMTSVFVLFVLLLTFYAIHLSFYYQIGFPASKGQNNSDHLILTASDWLGFLSGYLGFAGSLLMSIVVYIQSRDINRLTLAEYEKTVKISIVCCHSICDYQKKEINIKTNSLVQRTVAKSDELYYTNFCRIEDAYGEKTEKDPILLFVEIINNSKSSIDVFSFHSIEVIELSERNRQYKFVRCQDRSDPADRRTVILPGNRIKRCFMIEGFPCEIEKMGWLIFNFSCDNKCQLTDRVLFNKTGQNITVLNQ